MISIRKEPPHSERFAKLKTPRTYQSLNAQYTFLCFFIGVLNWCFCTILSPSFMAEFESWSPYPGQTVETACFIVCTRHGGTSIHRPRLYFPLCISCISVGTRTEPARWEATQFASKGKFSVIPTSIDNDNHNSKTAFLKLRNAKERNPVIYNVDDREGHWVIIQSQAFHQPQEVNASTFKVIPTNSHPTI